MDQNHLRPALVVQKMVMGGPIGRPVWYKKRLWEVPIGQSMWDGIGCTPANPYDMATILISAEVRWPVWIGPLSSWVARVVWEVPLKGLQLWVSCVHLHSIRNYWQVSKVLPIPSDPGADVLLWPQLRCVADRTEWCAPRTVAPELVDFLMFFLLTMANSLAFIYLGQCSYSQIVHCWVCALSLYQQHSLASYFDFGHCNWSHHISDTYWLYSFNFCVIWSPCASSSYISTIPLGVKLASISFYYT
jgi:hypothetical protein